MADTEAHRRVTLPLFLCVFAAQSGEDSPRLRCRRRRNGWD
jgi:hypothetical protein